MILYIFISINIFLTLSSRLSAFRYFQYFDYALHSYTCVYTCVLQVLFFLLSFCFKTANNVEQISVYLLFSFCFYYICFMRILNYSSIISIVCQVLINFSRRMGSWEGRQEKNDRIFQFHIMWLSRVFKFLVQFNGKL